MRARLFQILMVSACLAAFAPAAAVSAETAAPAAKPEGWSDKSYYLPMRDGVRLAVSLYFPPALKAAPNGGGKFPVLLDQTRYGRASGYGWYKPWMKQGYVVAIVDTRGTTSSFGTRIVDIGPEEVRDMEDIIAHLAAQSWSNGKVITTGGSYNGDTSDWATSRPAPALVGAVPLQVDFDAYRNLFFPGGVANDWFRNGWAENAREIDLGRDGEGQNLDCQKRIEDCAKLFPTLQPVDGDEDFTLLRQALAGRGEHWGPESYAGDLGFRDDKGLNGYTIFGSSPANALAGIRAQKKPVQYWGSWVDAGTADAALARFRSAPDVPAELWITGNNHSQRVSGDPFAPDRKTPLPTAAQQIQIRDEFKRRIMDGGKVDRTINYYVMGADVFRRTAVWPPEGVKPVRLSLAQGHRLVAGGGGRRGSDRYEIDYSATTGDKTRWSTQGGAPPAYPDRREADRKLVVYDGPVMTRDMEVAGYPVATLYMAASHGDPAVFAYLEDVAPDGRVTYVTEGQLRLVSRKIADPRTLPYDHGPAPHSFNRADALPVKPGEVMEVKFALLPTAALIRKGHRLRLAIAGHDADTFRRYPLEGPASFDIHYGGRTPSVFEVPMRPWRP
ncbi:CocE/NonD family hydrolase [Caulobacter mirabilis]|uniref:Xaa-Pro dipeptidyl-peptidase C-terminal domain-containing protein n=1 Tax=Caulobacter mirabilis TaxID=69666 RepID=A0A2D2B2Z5_9CAUL|nr:CocE/NonD family hydrolase [Caulobacter mirabilis]ATQ44586.1 hypothetical protein CSW64_20420 [Caulobacter mirabilis]